MAHEYRYPSPIVIDALRSIAFTISRVFWFIRFSGIENIPPNNSGPYLIASNHQTYIDPVWITIPLRGPARFMAIGKAFNWPLIGRFIRYLGAFPVSQTPSGARAAIKESIESLKEGAVLVVFPEGGRSFADGRLGEFKTGAAAIATAAGVPVLPVTISGGNRIWPQKQKYPHLFRRVTVKYHPPVDLGESGRADDGFEAGTKMLSQIIADALPADAAGAGAASAAQGSDAYPSAKSDFA